GIYTALLTMVLDSLFMKINLPQIQAEYGRLRARLAKLGWISHGYVQDRGPGAGGPCYQWTRKVKAKTVSVALSEPQYQALKQAIETCRDVQQTLQRMQELSREIIFGTLPIHLVANGSARKFWALTKGHSEPTPLTTPLRHL